MNGQTTNQSRCVDGTCTNEELRDSGCFICSNETGVDKCETCIEDHLLFYDKCVDCLTTEDCPFNNTNTTKCTNNDYSHCGFGVIGCKNHQCNMGGIGILIGCSVAVVVVPLLVFLIVHFFRKTAHNGYIMLSKDPLFSSAFDGLDIIDFFNPMSQCDSELFMVTDYSW